MALKPLSDDVQNMSYTELKARVEVLTRRVNSLTAMKISIIGSDQTPSITITETNSTLRLPDAAALTKKIVELEEEIVTLEAEIVALEEQARFAGDTITLNSVAIFETEPNATISATITLTSAVDAGGGNYTYSFSYTYTTTSDGFLPQNRTASIFRQGAQVVCVQIPVGGGSGSGTHQTTQARTNQIEWRVHASYSASCTGALGNGYEEKGFILTGT